MPRAAAKRPREAPDYPPLPADAVLLALDCSSTAVGYAVFCGRRLALAGLVPAAPKSWASSRRIMHNANATLDLIGWLEMERGLRVSHAALEWNSHMVSGGNRMATGLATLGQAQGYLLALIHERHPDVSVDLISERTWTRWSGSHLNIKKSKRAERIMLEIPEYAAALAAGGKDSGADAADALGLGLWRLGLVR